MGDWFDGGGGSQVDVAAVLDHQAALDGLLEMVQAGALLSLGTTSDGGALGVTVTVDGRWRREYVRSSDDLVAWLAEAVPAVRSAVEARPASSAPGKRSRSTRGL